MAKRTIEDNSVIRLSAHDQRLFVGMLLAPAGSQSYLAFSALLPFLSLALEMMLSLFGLGTIGDIAWHQVAIGAVMSAGAVWVLSFQLGWWAHRAQRG